MPYEEFMGGHCPPPKPDCDNAASVKYVTTCADINVPLELKPSAEVGRIETEFRGDPVVECAQEGKECCEVLVTQKVCVRVPITFKLKTCVDPSFIVCCVKPTPGKDKKE